MKDNIAPFKRPDPEKNNEPLLNLPVGVQAIMIVMVAIHVIRTVILSPDINNFLIVHLGFIPARYSGGLPLDMYAFISPFTHVLLHGSWMHVIINTVMLMAFGAAAERLFGLQKMVLIFALGSLCGVAAHLAFAFYSYTPVIGASGGISALFAVGLILLHKQGRLGAGTSLWTIIAVWVGISIFFGLLGSPDGQDVAWIAHLGGFAAGVAYMKYRKYL